MPTIPPLIPSMPPPPDPSAITPIPKLPQQQKGTPERLAWGGVVTAIVSAGGAIISAIGPGEALKWVGTQVAHSWPAAVALVLGGLCLALLRMVGSSDARAKTSEERTIALGEHIGRALNSLIAEAAQEKRERAKMMELLERQQETTDRLGEVVSLLHNAYRAATPFQGQPTDPKILAETLETGKLKTTPPRPPIPPPSAQSSSGTPTNWPPVDFGRRKG